MSGDYMGDEFEPRKKHTYQSVQPPRRTMPVTRHSVTHTIRHTGDLKIYIIVGFYTNGDPGEVFVKIGKEGSTLAGLMDIIGVQISQMLQTSLPWGCIESNLLNTNFEPLNSEGKSIAHVIGKAITTILRDERSRFETGQVPLV